jgi:hypothetical protein
LLARASWQAVFVDSEVLDLLTDQYLYFGEGERLAGREAESEAADEAGAFRSRDVAREGEQSIASGTTTAWWTVFDPE